MHWPLANPLEARTIEIHQSQVDLARFRQAIFSSELAIYVIRIDGNGMAIFEDANDTVAQIASRPLSQVRGQKPIDCLPPEVAECLETNLQKCLLSGESVTYERSLDLPDGRVAFRTSLMPVACRSGKVGHIVGMTRDITREADLIDEARNNAVLLQRLGIALPTAIYLLNVQKGTIRFIGGEVDPHRQQWRRDMESEGSEAAMRFFHPEDRKKAEAHLLNLAAMTDGDVSTIDFRILAASGEYRPHLNRETVFSRNAAGEVEYVLGISEDVTEQHRAQKEVRDLSERMLTLQLDERRRIAEELHDSTGQHLIGVSLALVRARAALCGFDAAEGQGPLVEALDDAKLSLQVAQREIRMLSYLLHPPEIVSEGLSEAVTNFARGFARRAGLGVEIHVASDANTISDDISLNLFRVCQEALTNVYRHAEASKVVISLQIDESSIRLQVTDDGVGFDTSQSLGVGLAAMHERMKRLGGEVQVSSGPSGTALLAAVPRVASALSEQM